MDSQNIIASWIDPDFLPFGDKLPHSLLLIDPQHHGACKFARIYAKNLLCLNSNQQKACDNCHSCHLFNKNNHLDSHFFDEINNIEQIRNIQKIIETTPSISNKRLIYLSKIDEYGINALNALLKTLEEPPKHSYFLLSAKNRHRVLPTILSRCQTANLPLPNHNQSLEWLKQQQIESEKAELLLDYCRNNPYLALEKKDLPNPIDDLPLLIDFMLGDCKFLFLLDKLPKNNDHLYWCQYQIALLIYWQQYKTTPKFLENPQKYQTKLYNINQFALSRCYQQLSKLRQQKQLTSNIILQIKNILIDNFHNKINSL